MAKNNAHEVVLLSLQSEPRMKFDLLAKGKRPEKETDAFPNGNSQFLLRKMTMNNQRRVTITELTVPREVGAILAAKIQEVLRDTAGSTAISGGTRARAAG